MKHYNILVTGVGALIGYGIVRSLRKSRYPSTIIGTDIYADAVGGNWCDDFEQAVLASDDDYIDNLRRIIDIHDIDLVIPGIEQDLARIVRDFDLLSDAGTTFVLNNPHLIEITADKWNTHLQLVENRFPVIPSYIEGKFDEVSSGTGLPMLLKLRRSYASKGMQIIRDSEDYSYWKKKSGNNFMVQQIVGCDDEEYTVSAFGYGDGTCSKPICFRRKLSGEGATVKAELVMIEDLERMVDRLSALFSPIGPTNFQFRNHGGEFLLLEINPRISSATSIRTAFGFNEAEMCIEYFLENKRPGPESLRSGTAIRYIEDVVTYDSDNL